MPIRRVQVQQFNNNPGMYSIIILTQLCLLTKFSTKLLTTSICCSFITVFVMSSLGTHCTGQFSCSCVWRAHNPSAGRLDVVEQSSILISSASWHSLRVSINAFIHASIVCVVSSHQVAIVLLCPGGRAGGLCRYGQHCPPGGNVAHCTRHIVVIKC